ncbi:MAG: ornithine cyclodeaminase family protein, partial [Gammaproteobacteria bacterium]
MTRILTLEQISVLLREVELLPEIERAFTAYSAGRVAVPPVGELLFPEARGEAHIKYGAIRGGDYFLVKIATGFFDNPSQGLPPFGGCMVLFSQKSGQLEAVLLEEGTLTNLRTAAAGAVAARHLAPSKVERIGIVGTGVQARLQADFLRQVTPCRELVVWGRDKPRAEAAAQDIAALGYRVSVAG